MSNAKVQEMKSKIAKHEKMRSRILAVLQRREEERETWRGKLTAARLSGASTVPVPRHAGLPDTISVHQVETNLVLLAAETRDLQFQANMEEFRAQILASELKAMFG